MPIHVADVGPLLVSRRRRDAEDAWTTATSWFGGLPRLGQQAWPRRADGRALPFGAQIDCADLNGLVPDGTLPQDGSLAFFLDAGAVVYVPPDASNAATPLPPFALAAHEPHGDLFPDNPTAWATPTFPRWPVAITSLDPGPYRPDADEAEDDDARVEAYRAALAGAAFAQVPTRPYFLGARAIAEALAHDPTPIWWHTVQAYRDQVAISHARGQSVIDAHTPYLDRATATVARLTPPRRLMGLMKPLPASPELEQARHAHAKEADRNATLRAQLAGLPDFLAEVSRFCTDRSPWAPLDEPACNAFTALMEQGWTRYPDILRYRTARHAQDLAVETVKAMMTGEPDAFAELPAAVRDLINDQYRAPPSGWHQMFGPGTIVQDAADAYSDHHMLLQLMYDDMLDWRFGDMGLVQFWISPEALAAREWHKAFVTYESH